MARNSLTTGAVGLIATLLSAGSPTFAGSLSPDLVRQLAREPGRSRVSVIVHLRQQAPMDRLRSGLKARRATRREWHRETVTALREAARSQQPLCAQLEADRGAGWVTGYTPYWISNLVIVQATVEEVERLAARADVAWVEPNFHPVLIAPVSQLPSSSPPMARRGIGV